MSLAGVPRALMVGVERTELPWWWKHVDHEALGCQLDFWSLGLKGGRPRSPFSRQFATLAVRTARMLVRARRQGYRYVFTFENDWLTFLVAGFQTALLLRRPRHVILQFIMRERTGHWRSRVKYAFMRWCFRSVHLCVCSSRPEMRYYERAFNWTPEKLAFVPFHTDPAFVERTGAMEEPFMLSAGRTFRDYPTLLQAGAASGVALTIVCGRHSLDGAEVPPGVTVHHDVPLPELIALIERSMAVVLPLQTREISIGQSVLLEAMAMGKPVIATRVNGTVDYLEHMKTGLLVPPNDPAALGEAMRTLARAPELRRRIGQAGREAVLQRYLPDHYAQGVATVLRGRR
jgi:glycosyltransferase involved in cell wall biosynthesis